MKRRYFFVCPDGMLPSGGLAVLYRTAEVLREHGYNASILHGSPSAIYPWITLSVPRYYSDAMPSAMLAKFGRRRRIFEYLKILRDRHAAGPNPRIRVGAEDVVVLPEFYMAYGLQAFRTATKVVFSQNPFLYERTFQRAAAAGWEPNREIFWNLGIADICLDAFEARGASPVSYFPVQADLENFKYREDKLPLITYMPRKRREEAQKVGAMLRQRGNVRGFDLQAIDGCSQAEVSELLARSAIFISFMKREALGFPAMEAMSSGCVVVGYTGVGTREYFDETTGIPVSEGDTEELVLAVERTAQEWQSEPDRLHAMRLHASRVVNERYSRTCFVEGVYSAFSEIDAALDAKRDPA